MNTCEVYLPIIEALTIVSTTIFIALVIVFVRVGFANGKLTLSARKDEE